ncbi:MAG: transglycosylase domain-containing protein, partial [Spirochaetes bacterium]|nr:transglycosylase domain-containing protein [Spirochaetota bacterium]
MNNKEEVSVRLEYLNNGLEQEKEELFLSPGLKKCENSVIYDRNLRVIGEYSTGRRKIISKNKIPPFLVRTLLLMEDSKFYTHNGFDYRTITGLLFEDMKVLPFIHGGYTITQELSKVL